MVRKVKPLVKKPKLPKIILGDGPQFDPDLLGRNKSLLKAFGNDRFRIIDPDDIDDDDIFADDVVDAPASSDHIDFAVDEADIADLCGVSNAMRGLGILMRGDVGQRAFDGHIIRAQVTDDGGIAAVSYDFDQMEFHCSLGDQGRGRMPRACPHVAALQYAWLRQPKSFALANLGAALELFSQRPEIFEGTDMPAESLQSALAIWETASPSLRAKIGQMSARSSPEDVALLQTLLDEFAIQERDQEIAGLLGRLTLEQLRAIAKRRHWTLRATAKTKAVAELIEQLRASPLPDSFTPEEEQLVRIENTLWGLQGLPLHQNLLTDWQVHGGGNLKRLEHALEGLQNAGVLLACTGEGMGLHYHWSPFLSVDMLPLLQPNVALAPSKGTPSHEATSLVPLLSLLDAVLIFAERELLRLRPSAVDPRLEGNTLVGQWPYLPEELKGVAEPGGMRRPLPTALTIPFPPFLADETREALSALAGGLPDYGNWAAAMLLQLGLIQGSPSGEAVVDPTRVSDWHMLSPDQQLERLWKVWCTGVTSLGDFRMALEDKEFILRRSPFDQNFTPLTLSADMGLAREFVVRVLAMLSPQTWYAWPAFAACIKRLRSSFLYTFTAPQQWWIEHAPSAKRYDANILQQWDAAWLPVLQTMLTGPLRWFGAIETAGESSAAGPDASSVQRRRAADGEPAAGEQRASSPQHRRAGDGESPAFRITPLGAWLFSGGRRGHVPDFAAAVVTEGPTFEWLDETTFRVRATPDAMRALAPLRVYAEPSRELLTFRLSMPAIGRALSQGAAASSIAETFGAAGLPLAAAVQERIAALGERTGRLNLYERVTVLELGDDLTLRELLATTALRAHIVHEFSPRLIVVRDEAVDALLAELVKKGHTPLVQ